MSTIEVAALVPTGTWSVDPIHSSVGFGVKHLGVSTFRGSFPGLAGSITTANETLVAASGIVDVASLETSDPTLTGHLRSDDFFAASEYPQATFQSNGIAEEDGDLDVTGELTIRGITLPVRFTGAIDGVGSDPSGSTRIGVSLTGSLDRTAYGIDWNAELANGAVAVANAVTLELHIEAVLDGESA